MNPKRNKLKGIDLKHAKDYTYWTALKDTLLLSSDRFVKMTPEEQDLVVSEIMKYYEWLPESMRPNIYKAGPSEDWPIYKKVDGYYHPNDKILLINRKLPAGPPGTNNTFDDNNDCVVESAWIEFVIPFRNNAQMREIGAPLFCVNDSQDDVYSGKSAFDTSLPSNTVMSADIKAIYLNALFPQGSDFNKYWKMPY